MEEALADHDRNVVNLLKLARSVNLKFNKSKLRLKLDQVTYMGQLFTSEGLKPDQTKVETTASTPRPDDKRAVQRLLGCELFVQVHATALKSVWTTTQVNWEECHVHLGQLTGGSFPSNQKHDQLCTPVEVLWCGQWNHYPMWRLRVGLGATLLQEGELVAFASRSLNTDERQYAQIDKECLAIVFLAVVLISTYTEENLQL